MKVCFENMQSKVTICWPQEIQNVRHKMTPTFMQFLSIAWVNDVWHSGSLEFTYIDKTDRCHVTSFHVKHICQNPMWHWASFQFIQDSLTNFQLFCLNAFLQISVQFMMYRKSPRDSADGDEETAALLQNWTVPIPAVIGWNAGDVFEHRNFHSHSWQDKNLLTLFPNSFKNFFYQ